MIVSPTFPSHPESRHPAAVEVDTLLQDCRIETFRSSGPGGQHRNKTESGVRITHEPSGVQATATERREQPVNRKVAIKRLRVNLAIELRGYFNLLHEPTPRWSSRVQSGRVSINPKHDDYPALLAEVLDVLEQKNFEPKRAGMLLAVSASQIIKLLRQEPRALAMVNARRQAAGKHTLK